MSDEGVAFKALAYRQDAFSMGFLHGIDGKTVEDLAEDADNAALEAVLAIVEQHEDYFAGWCAGFPTHVRETLS